MVTPSTPVTPSDVARHYDQLDRFYRDVWGEHVHHGYWKTGSETREQAARAMVDLVIEHAKLKPGMRVLDVGCGYGATARIIAREFGAEVTGLTISPQQQRHAVSVSAGEGSVRIVCEDWLENRQASESFDLVIAMESTEHMPDKQRALTEIARVLKPGGRAVMVAWLAANHRSHWQDAHLIEPICREARLAALGTPSEYEAWMTTAGLEVAIRRDISAKVCRTWPVTAAAFVRIVLRRPRYARYLLDGQNNNPVFALTMLRIWLGYRLGAIRMMLFEARKPSVPRN
jgi:tocopherol O-methyltransferase